MCESPLKCCVYGCGAIGLDLAVHLIKAGHAVTLVARGETFTALRDRGIEHVDSTGLRTEIKPDEFRLQQTETMGVVQDLVFLTVKADALTTIAHEVSPLLSEDSIVVSATNGIPPWYSYKQDGTIGRFLKDVSVREKFLRHIPAEHIIGATIERSASRSAPSTVSQTFGAGYVIGEPTHKVTDRLEKLRCLLEQSGLSARMSDNIHRDIWVKLLGNVCVSPMSVLKECNIGELLADDDTKAEMQKITEEAEAVGIKLGVIHAGDFDIDELVAFAQTKLRHHEPSMLQDFRRGAALEIHRIVEVVIMLAELPGMDLPVEGLRFVHQRLIRKLDERDSIRS